MHACHCVNLRSNSVDGLNPLIRHSSKISFADEIMGHSFYVNNEEKQWAKVEHVRKWRVTDGRAYVPCVTVIKSLIQASVFAVFCYSRKKKQIIENETAYKNLSFRPKRREKGKDPIAEICCSLGVHYAVIDNNFSIQYQVKTGPEETGQPHDLYKSAGTKAGRMSQCPAPPW